MLLEPVFIVPATFIPVVVTTTTFGTLVIEIVTLEFASTLTLLLPLVIEDPPDAIIPVSCEPLPIKKLALTLPFASRRAIVFAVLADDGAYPFNESAFKFATNVVELTINGAVPVAILEISCKAVTLAVARTCAVPKLPTLAFPEILYVPFATTPVLVAVHLAVEFPVT